MLKFFPVIERLLLTLWVGGMWCIGYIVAPLLFAVVAERQLAGMIAGKMFDAIHIIGLMCGALLLLGACAGLGKAALRDWRIGVLLAMLAIIVLSQWGIRPEMMELKQQDYLADPALKAEFAKWHGISSVLYLINSLLGLLLVIKGVTPIRRAE